MKQQNNTVPLVFVTNLIDFEYKSRWSNLKYGFWIVEQDSKPQIREFEELQEIYGNTESWEQFEKKKIEIPDGVIALVLRGNTGDNEKPHQLDILRRLQLVGNHGIDHVVIHVGEGKLFNMECKEDRFLPDSEKFITYDDSSKSLSFFNGDDKNEIPLWNYSLNNHNHWLTRWIYVISMAVKAGGLSCAVDRLRRLHQLLENYNTESNVLDINKIPLPRSCYTYEIVSWIPRLFEDLFIDLKGLSELRQEAENAPPKEQEQIIEEIRQYLSEILADMRGTSFRQKLADARYLAFGKTYGNGVLDCENKSGNVPIQESSRVIDLFEGSNLKEVLETEPCKEEKKKLAKSLGLKIIGRGFPIDRKHFILPFLIHLDCVCNKATDQINDADIAEILNRYNLFCDWYAQLIENIDSLKKTIR